MPFWRKEPPPKLWIQKPGWVTIIITLIVIFVLGPVGAIYNGMAEEQKENKGAIIQNQLAIKELLTRQQMILAVPKAVKIQESTTVKETDKKPVPPDYFEAYMNLTPENKTKYKLYLEQSGFDIRGLP